MMRGWGVLVVVAGLTISGCVIDPKASHTAHPQICGSEVTFTDTGPHFVQISVRDEGSGVVSDISESPGMMSFRELELVDCRAGVLFRVSDGAIAVGETLDDLPDETAFIALVEKLRAAGNLSDLDYSLAAFEESGSAVSRWRKWQGKRTQVRLADKGVTTQGYACGCQRFYPGTLNSWVPSSAAFERNPKTLPEARAMVAAWRAEQRAAVSARTDN